MRLSYFKVKKDFVLPLCAVLACFTSTVRAELFPVFRAPIKSIACASMLTQMSQFVPDSKTAKANHGFIQEVLRIFQEEQLQFSELKADFKPVQVENAIPGSEPAKKVSRRIRAVLSESSHEDVISKIGVRVRGKEKILHYIQMLEDSVASMSKSTADARNDLRTNLLDFASFSYGTYSAHHVIQGGLEFIQQPYYDGSPHIIGMAWSLFWADFLLTYFVTSVFPKRDQRFVKWVKTVKRELDGPPSGGWIYYGNNYALDSDVFYKAKQSGFLPGDVLSKQRTSESKWGHIPAVGKALGKEPSEGVFLSFDYLIEKDPVDPQDYVLSAIMQAHRTKISR